MRVELRKKTVQTKQMMFVYTQKHMVVMFTLIFMELKKHEKL